MSYKCRQVCRRCLFFTFKKQLNIDWRVTGCQQRLGGLELSDHMAFAIYRAARVDFIVALNRLEWRRVPSIGNVRRLHVIVTVHQHRRRIVACAQPLAVNNGVSCGSNRFRSVKTDALQVGNQPCRCALYVLRIFWHRTHAGNAQQFFQLFTESWRVVEGILVCVRHSAFLVKSQRNNPNSGLSMRKCLRRALPDQGFVRFLRLKRPVVTNPIQ